MPVPAAPVLVALGSIAGHAIKIGIAWLWRGIAATFMGITGSIVARVLLSLGLAMVSYKGMDIVIDGLKTRVISAANGLPADIFNLFLLAGGGYCLNMLFGAITFRLAYWTATRATQLLGVKG